MNMYQTCILADHFNGNETLIAIIDDKRIVINGCTIFNYDNIKQKQLVKDEHDVDDMFYGDIEEAIYEEINAYDLVDLDYRFLKYLKDVPYGLLMRIVSNFGVALKFVKEQTPELCMEAVKQNGWALQYVKEQTPELCLEAVKNSGGSALKYVKEQTPELCIQAIIRNLYSINYINVLQNHILVKTYDATHSIPYTSNVIEFIQSEEFKELFN